MRICQQPLRRPRFRFYTVIFWWTIANPVKIFSPLCLSELAVKLVAAALFSNTEATWSCLIVEFIQVTWIIPVFSFLWCDWTHRQLIFFSSPTSTSTTVLPSPGFSCRPVSAANVIMTHATKSYFQNPSGRLRPSCRWFERSVSLQQNRFRQLSPVNLGSKLPPSDYPQRY